MKRKRRQRRGSKGKQARQLAGIILAIIGAVLVVQTVPLQIWYYVLIAAFACFLVVACIWRWK